MCYDDNALPPLPPVAGGATASGEDLVLTAADGNRFAAYLALPDQAPRAQVLIYPDVRGLFRFYKELALRFAEQGLAALAIDYFGRTAGLTARDEGFDHAPHVQQLHFDTFQLDVAAALAHLRSGERANLPTFVVGFCMGGSLGLLTGTRDTGLAGIVGFYAGMTRSFAGAGTALERAAESKYPVLGLFGGADPGIPPEHVEALERALATAGVEHEIITYPGAPHSFFDRRADQHADASADAWTRLLRFIEERSG
jgi:carboxymethylenebutenolidase